MRHVVGFIVGIVLVPVILLGTGWALPRITAVAESGGTFVGVTGLSAIGALSLLALFVAVVLAAPRLTPLLPGSAGLALAGLTALDLVRPDLVARIPHYPGVAGATTLLELGLYLPLALALILPLFLSSRWQSYRPRGAHAFGKGEEPDEDDDDYEDSYADYRDDTDYRDDEPRRGSRDDY
ncbi:hypothetical protein [Nocardiopsis ansamitocini]|uniref:Uncharacterized protein n=1 Tax=Nocardiopsis ansamitocini TaxID=1670832 RepID=A0A9W6P7H3_9ACTN|nr:hypothetical protein [Nocardiopsis ansamitocini]GLU48441.1 hypothetical protein Nans01_27920 [Nocardiopsis ansamitocini]